MSESMDGAIRFVAIRTSYAADSDIVCRFDRFDSNYKPDDIIAIKKIGWKDDELQNSPVSVSAADAAGETGNIMRVTFSPSLLSELRTADELFQFCYISGDRLRGVSTTFTIIRPEDSDYGHFARDEEVNDADGFVVLKTPQAQFQDSIEQLQTKLNICEERNQELELKVQLLQKECCKLTQEKVAALLDNDRMAETSRQKEQQLERTLEQAIASHSEKWNKATVLLENEKKKGQDMLRGFEEMSRELTRVREGNAELRKTVDDLTRRRQEDQQFCEANEMMVKALKDEIQSLNDEVKNLQHEKSVADAEHDFAASSLRAAQKALDREAEQRKRDQEEWKGQEAGLKTTVDNLTLRLAKGREEYEEKARLVHKLEGKLQRFRDKINQCQTAPKSRSSSDPVADPGTQNQPPIQEERPVREESDNVTLPCSVCGSDVLSRAMVNHLEEEHRQLVCPVCALMFDKNIPGIDSYFHCHVESHLDPFRYPRS